MLCLGQAPEGWVGGTISRSSGGAVAELQPQGGCGVQAGSRGRLSRLAGVAPRHNALPREMVFGSELLQVFIDAADAPYPPADWEGNVLRVPYITMLLITLKLGRL